MGKYTQFYTLYDVNQKRFDGSVPLSDVVAEGDFGIGTFNSVHGEMIVVDKKIYRAVASGEVEEVTDLTELTPYAIVSEFKPDLSQHVQDLNLKEIQERIDTMRVNEPDGLYSVEVSGHFKYARSRAPDQYEAPYPDLEQLIADQPSSTFNDIDGQLLGFYTPDFLASLGVPGYHLHFIDAARSCGGHLQDAYIVEGTIKLQLMQDINIQNPSRAGLQKSA